MRTPLVWAAVTAASLLLTGAFVRALPTAVEKVRVGDLASLHALCDSALRSDGDNAALGSIPAMAPDFKLKDYAGREIALSSLRGRVVLVNFWATWCPTCVVEMPSLDKLAAEEKGRDFTLLAVSVDDNWETVRQFFQHGTGLTVLLDNEKKTPALYGTEKFPESFLIDRDGRVVFYVVSDRNWAAPNVRACIDRIIDS